MKTRKSDKSVAKAVEAALLCTLTRVEVTGLASIDLSFNVDIDGEHAENIVDALAKHGLQKDDYTGKAYLEHVACEHCSKLMKDILHFSVVFGRSSESTCQDCGPLDPVRRTERRRSKKTTYTAGSISADKAPVSGLHLEDASRKKTVQKSDDDDDLHVDCANQSEEAVGDPSLCGKTTSKWKYNFKAVTNDLVCEICGGLFTEEKVFVDHLLTHSDLTLLKCAVCGGTFSSKYVLKKHMMRHVPEENRPYWCEICKKGFTEAFYYREHVKNHGQVKPYLCRECPKRYGSATALRRHSLDHVLVKSKKGDSKGKTNSKALKKPKADYEAEDDKRGRVSMLVDDMEESIDEEPDIKGDSWENIGNNTDLSDSCENDSEVSKTVDTVKKLIHKCCTCGHVFQSKSALKSHIATHKSAKKSNLKCKLCSEEFMTDDDLQEHQHVHSSGRPFPCDVCGKSFFNRQVMERHASKHIPAEEWKHVCGVCDKRFSHISYLHDHRWIHADEKPYKCAQCDKCYVSSQSLRKHSISHQSGVHRCGDCLQRFPTAHRLAEHTYAHTGILPFSCEVCGKRFKLHKAFSKHGQVHMKPMRCNDCEKQFYTKRDLEMHSRIHSGYRPFQCDVCGKTYTRKEILKKHAMTHSEDYYMLKTCSVCGKKLRGNRALHQHLQTHEQETKYVCEQCGKCFQAYKALWSHKNTHEGFKPHACKHCDKRFRSLAHCRNHMKTHTGENLEQCPLCKDWFTDANYMEKVHPKFCKGRQIYCSTCGRGLCNNRALQSHIGLHSGARPFGCETCGRAFTKDRFLQEHIKRHLENKSHLCRICGKGFNCPADLRNHERRHDANKQMKCLLSQSKKFDSHEKKIAAPDLVTAAVSGMDQGSGDDIVISVPNTIIEEVHCMSHVEHFPADCVVLATIDIDETGPGNESQLLVQPEYGMVQPRCAIQFQDSGHPVVHDMQQFPPHEYNLAPAQLHNQSER